MIQSARPLDTLRAMVATDDPKERIRIFEAANPTAAVERMFGNLGIKGFGINPMSGAA